MRKLCYFMALLALPMQVAWACQVLPVNLGNYIGGQIDPQSGGGVFTAREKLSQDRAVKLHFAGCPFNRITVQLGTTVSFSSPGGSFINARPFILDGQTSAVYDIGTPGTKAVINPDSAYIYFQLIDSSKSIASGQYSGKMDFVLEF